MVSTARVMNTFLADDYYRQELVKDKEMMGKVEQIHSEL